MRTAFAYSTNDRKNNKLTNRFNLRFRSRLSIFQLSPAALDAVVNFMYTSEILINEENVLEFILTSSLLQIDEVFHACTHFVKVRAKLRVSVRALVCVCGCMCVCVCVSVCVCEGDASVCVCE